MPRATGPFDVTLKPQPTATTAGLGRFSIDKQYRGDLEAISKGEMLSAGGNVQGSAGYVAIERVSGTLQGKNGSFILQHVGTMNRGTPQLTVTVIPDSGTDELTGLSGSMHITNAAGKHVYAFDYTLPPESA